MDDGRNVEEENIPRRENILYVVQYIRRVYFNYYIFHYFHYYIFQNLYF